MGGGGSATLAGPRGRRGAAPQTTRGDQGFKEGEGNKRKTRPAERRGRGAAGGLRGPVRSEESGPRARRWARPA